MKVANQILEQLGGNKFIAMTGSRNFIDCGNALSMHLTTNKAKAKYLKIELTSMDLYSVTFSRNKKVLNKEYAAAGVKIYDDVHEIVKTFDNVYAEDLQMIFTSVTGLYTRL